MSSITDTRRLGIAVYNDGVEARDELLPLAGCPSLHQPEVEERDISVAGEPVVAGVGVAVERTDAMHGVLREAPDGSRRRAGARGDAAVSQELGPRQTRRPTRWSAHASCWSPGRRQGCDTKGWSAKCVGELRLVGCLEP